MFSSFKQGFKQQLSEILNWLGRLFLIVIAIGIPTFILLNGGTVDGCAISEYMPLIAGILSTAGLILLIGNPLIAILAGGILGLILDLPLIKHFLCQ
ncbi:MAG: hypothetical protein GW795_12300 [Cyanobacteria bacterium]|nr:hypothetical protein [Cyanobacteria bacterium CG_2015-16_32_12]NCO78972.1 hypothetical protein [Cyanobacteria bacterium CG_2015-22_32_23]NCQ03099.1 hypothetical protein [Cyanobacteria bacterium CG_2015-09_32_10]NCQ42625.1 hypothetical protein [Cyanobacteria bacterium CG_2015-04_32_10]NCS83758.1 hypothetical protein [Cyanobacteria bacterium CG_2015-02_32_10]